MWSSRRPTSERAVTIVSSSCGWRSTSAAQSAPANPAAPRTATLCTQPRPQAVELTLDRRTGPRHVLVGQRPLGRAELEPQGQRLAALAELLAAVDVEDLDAVEQPARAGTHGGHHGGGRRFLPHHHRDVLDDRREGAHVAVAR